MALKRSFTVTEVPSNLNINHTYVLNVKDKDEKTHFLSTAEK